MTRRRALHASPFKSPVEALLDDDDPLSSGPPIEQPLSDDAADNDETASGAHIPETRLPEISERSRTRRRTPVNRTGTRTAPYERKDGVATVKIAFSASAEFEARLRVFVAGLPPDITRNQWLEQALAKAIAKEEKHR